MHDSVYIIGGGSSLNDYDFSALENKDTIAVNVAALDVPNPTYCITADSTIFRRLENGEFSHIDTAWVLVSNANHCTLQMQPNGSFKNIRTGFVHDLFAFNMVIRNHGVEGIGFRWQDFRTGYNSGFCALQLAVLLGYKEIHLLGFDMRSHPQSHKCHYHNRYRRRITQGTFQKYLTNFIVALKILKDKTDIKVYSRSSISILNEYIEYYE